MPLVIYEKKGNIAYVTLNRPDADNRINVKLAQELADACTRINEDDEVYVALITGAGTAFCTGADVPTNVAEAVAAVEKPVIAAINGDAFAYGFELALSCDMRIISDDARFCLPQVSLGQIPSGGATQRLPRLIGKGKAIELILTAAMINAEEALNIGLVSQVVPEADLAAEAEKLVQGIATKAPVSLRYVKEAVNKGMDMTMDQGLRLEADLYLHIHTTQDRTEGITAFLEKRTPEFKGE